MDRAVIEQYRAGGPALGAAIAGLSPDQLHAHPVAEGWSVAEIVWHLADAELVTVDRMNRIIAEDNPPLLGFDQSLFTKNLFYGQRDPAVACRLFATLRESNADLLSRLPAEAFERAGLHTERGKITLGALLPWAVDHLEHHLTFLRQKRALLEKA